MFKSSLEFFLLLISPVVFSPQKKKKKLQGKLWRWGTLPGPPADGEKLTDRQESFSLGGGKSGKRFPLAGTVIAANPGGVFGGEAAECVLASQAAGRRRDGEDISTKGRSCFVCGARLQNRQSDTGKGCVMDRTDPVTPTFS